MKLFYLCLSFVIFLSLTGCSSNDSGANTTANSAVTVNTANPSTTAGTAAQNANVPEGQTSVVVNVDPNAFNGVPDPDQKVTRIDPKNDKTTSGIYGRSAPDNSTFKSTMDAKGVAMETRTFIKDPYIIKVERIFTMPKKTIKIYLKSGRVAELPEEKLPNFAAATPGDILVAAGVDIKKLQTNTQGIKPGNSVKTP